VVAVEAIAFDFVSNAKLGGSAQWTGADPERLLADTVEFIPLPNPKHYTFCIPTPLNITTPYALSL